MEMLKKQSQELMEKEQRLDKIVEERVEKERGLLFRVYLETRFLDFGKLGSWKRNGRKGRKVEILAERK